MPGQWAELLTGLALQQHAPYFWDLVCDDASQAAFMQPALAISKLAKNVAKFPSGLDALVASKNHDVKENDIANARPWHWLCALVTGQTTGGYAGKTLYGVMRMNTGSGTRFFAAGYNDDTEQGRWTQDVTRLLRYWVSLYENNSFGYHQHGLRLVAAWPWDGCAPLEVADLHPGAIEICRPMRLYLAQGDLQALYGGTSEARIRAKLLRGSVADPWTALARDKDGLKALSPSPDTGFTWSNFLNLLFNPDLGLVSPFMLDVDTSKDVTYRLRALSRSRTETSGYQNFAFTFPGRVAKRLFGPAVSLTEREVLLQRHQAAAEVGSALQRRMAWSYCKAHSALDADTKTIQAVGKAKHHEAVLGHMRNAYTQRWQQALLPWLCASVTDSCSDEEALGQWFAIARDEAETLLRAQLMPRPGAVRTTSLGLAKGLAALPRTLAQLQP